MRYNVFDQNRSSVVCGDTENVFSLFLLTKGLYDSIDINQGNFSDLIELLAGNVRLSSYCKECKEERVFSMRPVKTYSRYNGEITVRSLSDELAAYQKRPRFVSTDSNIVPWEWYNSEMEDFTRVIVLKYICTMNEKHHLDFVVLTANNKFMKIGQYPSVADLTFRELDSYKKVMSDQDRKEIGRAIGLFASGIGAGSYVYLRRVLERLLLKAKETATCEIDEESFKRAKVAEKIDLLKNDLPQMLTSNSVIYSILSKGIHELSEADCLAYFPVVKDCIFLILDEWEDMRKKAEKEQSINSSLSKIATEIK